jgi:HK97 family phage major capsid protein
MTVEEIKAELQRAIQAFQTANDERFKKVEAGIITAQSSDKIEAHNADITRLKASLDDTMLRLGRMEVGGAPDKTEDREKLARDARQFMAGMKGTEPNRITNEDVEAYAAYAKAFPEYLRRGAAAMNDPDIRAAMSVGSDPDGGYWVPTTRMNEVIEKLYETSPMRRVSSVQPITSDSIEWPVDSNDATSGGWVGETDARAETATSKTGMQTLYAREQYAMPKVTQKLLDMSSINVEAWLGGKIAGKLVRTENTAFAVGTGVKQPRGVLDYAAAAVTTDDATRAWGVLQYVPSGAAGAFPTITAMNGAHNPDALITIASKVHPELRAGSAWLMSRSAEATIRKMKDGDGKYFIDMGDPRGAFTGFSIGGFPIETMEDFPAIASNSYSIAFGNFRVGYQIVDGRGIRVLRDNLTQKGFVLFYTTKWTGGDVVNSQAIKLLKFAAS